MQEIIYEIKHDLNIEARIVHTEIVYYVYYTASKEYVPKGFVMIGNGAR